MMTHPLSEYFVMTHPLSHKVTAYPLSHVTDMAHLLSDLLCDYSLFE